MHVIDDKNDMFKDKPIDDRGVPEILFDIALQRFIKLPYMPSSPLFLIWE